MVETASVVGIRLVIPHAGAEIDREIHVAILLTAEPGKPLFDSRYGGEGVTSCRSNAELE